MKYYLSEYDNFYGYIFEGSYYKADLGKDVIAVKALHLAHVIDTIKEDIKNEKNYNKENIFYYNGNHLLDYILGDIEKVKCPDSVVELLEKYRVEIKELKQNHGIKFIKGKVTPEIKENIKKVKSMLNNGDIYALNMSKLLDIYDEKNKEPKLKIDKKPKKEKDPKAPKIILTEEEKKIILIEQRKKVAESFINKDMSKYRDVLMAKGAFPTILDKKVSSLGIYTDGSMYTINKKNKNNVFKKGYGIIITDEDTGKILFRLRGKIEDANQIVNDINLVELYAVYRATYFVKSRIDKGFFENDVKINIHTDSLSTVKKFDNVIQNDNNVERISYNKIWEYLLDIEKTVSIKLNWVKGHSNNKMNKEADRVAKLGVELKGNKEELMSFSIIREVEDLFKETEHIKPKKNIMKP